MENEKMINFIESWVKPKVEGEELPHFDYINFNGEI
jgi:hypothetical protein